MSSSKKGPPLWLFSNNNTNTSLQPWSTTKLNTIPQKSKLTVPEMGKKIVKTAGKAKGASSKVAVSPPGQLMDMVESFLADHSFTAAHKSFKEQRKEKGWKHSNTTSADNDGSLVTVFEAWTASKKKPVKAVKKATKQESSSSSSSSASSASSSESDSESSNSSSSDSSSDSEAEVNTKTTIKAINSAGLKRKATESSGSDSDSDSDSSSSSGSDTKPQTKKQKLVKTVAAIVKSDSSSDSSDSEMDVDSSSLSESSDSSDSSSGSDSDSDSDSESDSDSSAAAAAVEVQKASKVALPSSDSSSSDSESDVEIAKPKKPNTAAKKQSQEASDSSVTLDGIVDPPLPPVPVAKNAGKRKQNVPFSRIPKDIKVDPKFASNEYIAMEYSQRAFDDLVVTKGKGFTKEKNKKKRGNFRGGAIDITQKKGVYFDD